MVAETLLLIRFHVHALEHCLLIIFATNPNDASATSFLVDSMMPPHMRRRGMLMIRATVR
jgi:hypothetical protein